MFELIDDSDKGATRQKLFVWGLVCAGFILVLLSGFIHRDIFDAIVFPSIFLIGTGNYWKRINRYWPSPLWIIIRMIPPILMVVAGWYQSRILLIVIMFVSAFVLMELEFYLKRRSKNREQLAEIGEAQK